MRGWSQLESDFRALEGTGFGARVDHVEGAGGEQWNLAAFGSSRAESQFRALARMAGEKLLEVPAALGWTGVAEERDPVTRWYRALRQHPQLNANVDDENGEILLRGTINLGCAVDTDHGLMVPVIGNADRLSIVQLTDAVTALAKQCRNRSIGREQLIGGTFTISNVGSYGGMFATPIINYPEVAILAVGRTKERVLTSGGRFPHRIDSAAAGQ